MAADALQQLTIAPHLGAAGSSTGAQQLMYMPAAAAAAGSGVAGFQHGMGAGSSSGGSLAGAAQPVMRVATPSGQQQVLMPVAVGQEDAQQVPVGLLPSGTPSMQQLAYHSQGPAGATALNPPGLVVVEQQQYAQAIAGPQQMLLHPQHRQRVQQQGPYEQLHQADDMWQQQQQVMMWQSPLQAGAAGAAAAPAGPNNTGGMVLLPQQPMPGMMAAVPAWGEADGQMPYYALPMASMTAAGHPMMLGAAGMQQQQPTPAQMMQLQQQHAQHMYYEQQQQQMLVYGQPGHAGAAESSSSRGGVPMQYMLPGQAAAGAMHVPPAQGSHAAQGRMGAYAAPPATAAADVSRYQMPPGQW
jgi:hypothetical protein